MKIKEYHKNIRPRKFGAANLAILELLTKIILIRYNNFKNSITSELDAINSKHFMCLHSIRTYVRIATCMALQMITLKRLSDHLRIYVSLKYSELFMGLLITILVPFRPCPILPS